ncbi:hypothetical protein SVIOM74S_01590 [Streptomyces violarus]
MRGPRSPPASGGGRGRQKRERHGGADHAVPAATQRPGRPSARAAGPPRPPAPAGRAADPSAPPPGHGRHPAARREPRGRPPPPAPSGPFMAAQAEVGEPAVADAVDLPEFVDGTESAVLRAVVDDVLGQHGPDPRQGLRAAPWSPRSGSAVPQDRRCPVRPPPRRSCRGGRGLGRPCRAVPVPGSPTATCSPSMRTRARLSPVTSVPARTPPAARSASRHPGTGREALDARAVHLAADIHDDLPGRFGRGRGRRYARRPAGAPGPRLRPVTGLRPPPRAPPPPFRGHAVPAGARTRSGKAGEADGGRRHQGQGRERPGRRPPSEPHPRGHPVPEPRHRDARPVRDQLPGPGRFPRAANAKRVTGTGLGNPAGPDGAEPGLG